MESDYDVYKDVQEKVKEIKRDYPKRNWFEEKIFEEDFEVLVGEWSMPRETWEKRTFPAVKSINSIIGKAPIKIISKDKEGHELDPQTGLIMPKSKKWAFDPQTKLFLITEEKYVQYKYELIYLEPTMVCKRRTDAFNYWKQHEDWGGFFIYGLNELPMSSTIVYLDLVYPEWKENYVMLRERFAHPRIIPKGSGFVVVNCNFCLKEDLQRAYDELKAGNMNVVKFFKDNLWTHYTESEEDIKRMLEDLDASINNTELESIVLPHTWAGTPKEEKELFEAEQNRNKLMGFEDITKIIAHSELQQLIDQVEAKSESSAETKKQIEARVEKLFSQENAHPLSIGLEKEDLEKLSTPIQDLYKKMALEKEKQKEEARLLKLKETERKARIEKEAKEEDAKNTEYTGPKNFLEFIENHEKEEKKKREQQFGKQQYYGFELEKETEIGIEDYEEEDADLRPTSLKIEEEIQLEFLEITNEKNLSKAIIRKIQEAEESPIETKPFSYYIKHYETHRNKEKEKRIKIKFPSSFGEELMEKYDKPLNTIINAHILKVVLEDRG